MALAAALCVGVLPAAVAAAAGGAAHTKLVALHDPGATMGDQFGHGVAISASGSIALVGAYDTSSGAGAAYVYKAGKTGWSTSPIKTFTDPGHGVDHFGFSVALSPDGTTAYVAADRLAVGARTGAGAVFVYHASKGIWPSTPTQTINDPGTASGDAFGVSIAVSPDGKTVAVGAPVTTVGGTAQAGEAYVYQASSGKLPTTPTASIPDPNPSLGRGFFGYTLSLSDVTVGKGILVSGAYVTTVKGQSAAGAAYIYQEKSAHLWVLAKGGQLTDPGDVG
ncbi:MAG TPA: hypothetical protein VIE15_00160, partial [Acidimicrobiales bacterium]